MATKESDEKDLLECSICLEVFVNPKCLPCIHTFCLQCLNKYGKEIEKLPGNEMACPICRGAFLIPPGGFEELPNHLFIEQMVEGKRIFPTGSASESAPVKCDGCYPTRLSDSTQYCLECSQSMCDSCAVPHANLRATQTHQVVSLAKRESSRVFMRYRQIYCNDHKTDPLRLYCYDCEQTICLMCAALKHKAHRCADIELYSDSVCHQLKAFFPKMDDFVEHNGRKLTTLDEYRNGMLGKILSSEKEIVARREELKRRIDEQSQQLLGQLVHFKKEKLKQVQEQFDRIELQNTITQSFKTYAEELVNNGSACHVAQSANSLFARTTVIETSQCELIEKEAGAGERITFELSHSKQLDEISGRVKRIGHFIGIAFG